MGGLGLVKGIAGDISAGKSRRNQIAGLRKLSEVTDAERDYEKRRQDIIKGGDPLINQAGRSAIQTIRQQGRFNQQRATGQVIQQGLEDSIVAQELRRKVDADTLRSVAEQARQMALANAEAKRRAESEIEALKMGQDARKRDSEAKIAGIGGYGPEDRFGSLMNIAGAGLSAYTGAGGDFTDFGLAKSSPWADYSTEALSNIFKDPDAVSKMSTKDYLAIKTYLESK
jgi:hypothetical protein